MTMTTTDITWVLQVRNRQNGEVSQTNPGGLYHSNGQPVSFTDVGQALELAINLEVQHPNSRYFVMNRAEVFPDEAQAVNESTYVIQVSNTSTGALMVSPGNPYALYSTGSQPITYPSIVEANDVAQATQRASVSYTYRAMSMAQAIANQARVQGNVPDTEATEAPTHGDRQPQIVAGDEGVTLAISQHVEDLATIDRVFADQARRRGWCGEYEGILRTINAEMFRPLLRGRGGEYGDTTPRAERVNRASQAIQVPGTIVHPVDAAAWGIWYITEDNGCGWLTHQGHERHTFATQAEAEAEAEAMRQDHRRCQYIPIPIPEANVHVEDVRITARGATYTAEQAAAAMEQLHENLDRQRRDYSTRNQQIESFLQALSERLYEQDEDMANEVINDLNNTQAFEIPLNERDYTVMGTVSITLTLNVPVSTTVRAASAEAAQEMAEQDSDSHVDDSDISEWLRYNADGYTLRDAWDGSWDDFEVSDVEEQ